MPPAWVTAGAATVARPSGGAPAYRAATVAPPSGGAPAHRSATDARPRGGASAYRAEAGQRPTARRPGRGIGWLWAGVVAGTVAATGLDRIVGGLDGKPALFLLVIFALPFWDALPARLPARLAVLAGLVAAVAAVWLALALARPESWWRGEVAFGLACAIVGTVHALASARRTVVP